MSEFLKTSEFTETRAFVWSFLKELLVKHGKATIIYHIPTPEDSPIEERTPPEVALNGGVMNSLHSNDRNRPTRRNESGLGMQINTLGVSDR